MPRARAEIASALRKKGFEERKGSRDHDYYFFVDAGLIQAVYTKLSRGRSFKTIDDSLLGRICRQLQLSRRQFDDLVDCPLDRDGYAGVLRARGILRP